MSDDDRRPIRRALVSVYDKSGLDELARALAEADVRIVSTGSTADRIEAAGVAVTRVEELTGFPECLDGRVKTLHPKVHAGLLADRRLPAHSAQLAELGVEPFDLLVSNLYPFRQTVAAGAGGDECVEQIDIGGPSMVRAAAKNHASVAVVTTPLAYPLIMAALRDGGFTLDQRRRLAARAFADIAEYDVAVAEWTAQTLAPTQDGWALKPDASPDHWVTHTVGFAGPDERYIVAVTYELPASATLADGVHAVSDLVALVFGAPTPAPVTVPPP